MAFYVSPTSKLARAVRALLVLQGKATWDDCFIDNDSRARNVLPNRTIQCPQFDTEKPHRPEGIVHLMLQHRHVAAVQPGDDVEQRRIDQDEYLGDTMDTLLMDGANTDQGCPKLAGAITDAGQWLAKTDGTAEGDAIAAKNSDMANFRVDWVKLDRALITRGESEHQTPIWVEIIHLTAFVSHANIPN